MSYLYIFLQSCLLEVPIYLWFLRANFARWEAFVLVVAINSVTHPMVFFGIMSLPLTYLQNIGIAESFAIISEALVLKYFAGTSWVRAALAGGLANLVSWQVAPILTYLLCR